MSEQELAKKIKLLVINTLKNSTVTLNLSKKFLDDLQQTLQHFEDSNKPKDKQDGPAVNKESPYYYTGQGGKTKRKYRNKKRTLRH